MREKNFITYFYITLFLLVFISCQTKSIVEGDYHIIPLPQNIQPKQEEGFTLNRNTKIVYPKEDTLLQQTAALLSEYIHQNTQLKLRVTDKVATTNAILLQTGYTHENPEAYHLTINKDVIRVNGSDAAGTFYGAQLIRKVLPLETVKTILFPAVEIEDYPRFEYRGAMLDVGRHIFPVEFIKKFIDILALHNINRFHWHLTEDQGWRIEIKKYPELTQIGSQRARTVIGKNTGEYDDEPYGGYYTQEEIKEIVAYAKARHVEVIPEIDLPGHMLAALATYPHLGCTGGPYEVADKWGVFEDVLCAGNEATYTFLENVFAEVVELFPYKYIHIGGDECPKTRWETCPKCQAKVKELGLVSDEKHSAEDRLQSHMIQRIEHYLNGKGKQIIGWDEILEGGIAPNATIMSWRGTSGGIEAAKQHHDVIMTPTSYLYFDYYQAKDIKNEPFAIGGYVPVEKVYEFEPVPKELTSQEQQFIKGVQANVWTEHIKTSSHAEYMLLPRLGALSEIQWTSPEQKNYEKFLPRLAKMTQFYALLGYNFATHIFDLDVKTEVFPEDKQIKVSLSTIDDAAIYYTLEGTNPTTKSFKYDEPITITSDTELKAAAIRESGVSNIYSKKFEISKATFKEVNVEIPPSPKHTYGGVSMLVDGITGSENFTSGEWVGFRSDFIATVDLMHEEEIQEVTIGTVVDVNEWISSPTHLHVYISSDNKTFNKVFSEEYSLPEMENAKELKKISALFAPQKGRYVKIVAEHVKELPEWSRAKGKEGFIFVDEITIR